MSDYKNRLQIPLEGSLFLKFYAHDGTHLATGYTRVVIGQRGPYVEFEKGQLIQDSRIELKGRFN